MNKRSLENKLYNNRYSAFRQYGFTENETQQILNNQVIVEKLQGILDDLEQYDELSKTHYYNLKLVLKSLLTSKTDHSKCLEGES